MRTIKYVSAVMLLLSLSAVVASCVALPDEVPDDEEHPMEAQDAILLTIKCTKEERGIGCMQRCAEALINCASGRPHPLDPLLGTGDLGQCRVDDIRSSCWYYYPKGNVCVFVGRDPYCRIEGGG